MFSKALQASILTGFFAIGVAGAGAKKTFTTTTTYTSGTIISTLSCFHGATTLTGASITIPPPKPTRSVITSEKKSKTKTVTAVATYGPVEFVVDAVGLSYYQYSNPFSGYDDQTLFEPTYFKQNGYSLTGLVPNLADIVTDYHHDDYHCTLPGQQYQENCTYIAVVMQGYFYAPSAGTYQFATPRVDNWAYLWYGDIAYSAWDSSNAAILAYYKGIGTLSVSLTLAAGEAVPITFLWANGGGPGNLTFEMTKPDGTVEYDTTGYLLPQCAMFVP